MAAAEPSEDQKQPCSSSEGLREPKEVSTFKSLVSGTFNVSCSVDMLGDATPTPRCSLLARSLQGVTEVLCEACAALGWKTPTKIQQEALPLAFEGREGVEGQGRAGEKARVLHCGRRRS